ncbi:serine protease HTRA2, mitochondrial-like [Gigantopelta aegis]|uniref:serine protease HTRA2, mitochondrial-like n=1 Tax=Gigantopelta aegis TaxID=1735272 RepID=UPI001B88CBB8|nr:serine protease HTRA2, mitochondrial-like [Gigantopelta aegis]
MNSFTKLFAIANKTVALLNKCPNSSVNQCCRSSFSRTLHSCKTRATTVSKAGTVQKLCIATGLSVSSFILYKCRHNLLPTGSMLPPVFAAEPMHSSPRAQFNFIADVVEKAAPAVVYIEIKGRHPYHGGITTMSNGSGFIVRQNGIILTNAHVVANKQIVVVKLHDQRVFEGTVTAVDPVSDLATIKIDANGLPTLSLGKSSSVRSGEWVIAMGSPLSLSNTVTAGIVSSIHRGSKELGIHNKDISYIQTDAVINFGNSGGPLVNLDGEAIGINTMKVTTGISFAIPSDYVQDFLTKADMLTSRAESKPKSWFGRVSSPKKQRYIGITILSLTPSIIRELQKRIPDFPEDIEHGVFVDRIIIGSPAYNGGLKPGDIITHINDKEVNASSDFFGAVSTNDILKLAVMRKQKRILLTIKPEEIE